jgi:hypothetical protein
MKVSIIKEAQKIKKLCMEAKQSPQFCLFLQTRDYEERTSYGTHFSLNKIEHL